MVGLASAVRRGVRRAAGQERVLVHHPAARGRRHGRQLDPDRAGPPVHPAGRELLPRAVQPPGTRRSSTSSPGASRSSGRAAPRADGLERAADRPVRAERPVRRHRWWRSAMAGPGRSAAPPPPSPWSLCSPRCTRRCSARTGCRTCSCPAYLAFVVAIASVAAGRHPGLLDRGAVRLVPDPRARLLPVLRAGAGARPSCRRWCAGPVAPAAPRVRADVAAPARGRRLDARRRSSARSSRCRSSSSWRCTGRANFAKYFAYSSSARVRRSHAAQVVRYVLWFWWPHAHAWAVPVLLIAVAGVVTWRLPAGPLRRFCVALLAVDAAVDARFPRLHRGRDR